MREKASRSIAKAISWRLVGTVDTMAIAWLITGKLGAAFAIGGVELFTKTMFYYFHERAWNRIKFGRTNDSDIDYQI
jgi:uncharacterized membrane protein